jgi:hypothetical protein
MLPSFSGHTEELNAWEELFSFVSRTTEECPSMARAREAREKETTSPPRKSSRRVDGFVEELSCKSTKLAKDQLHIEELLKAAVVAKKFVCVDAFATQGDSKTQSTVRDTSTVGSPPSTPRASNKEDDGPFTPPPLLRKWSFPESPLMTALKANSVNDVEIALKSNPGCARDLFWKHDHEPPLCFAVRTGCSSEVVRLLLEHGADVEDKDRHGRTALNILHRTSSKVATLDWQLPLGIWPDSISAAANFSMPMWGIPPAVAM